MVNLVLLIHIRKVYPGYFGSPPTFNSQNFCFNFASKIVRTTDLFEGDIQKSKECEIQRRVSTRIWQ